MKKWEISMLVGVLAVIAWCAVPQLPATCWWTSAFSPLCGDFAGAQRDCGEVVLRSRLWELAGAYLLH